MEILCETSLVREMFDCSQAAAPREACGVLGGQRHGDRIHLRSFLALPNLAGGPAAFEIDPLDFLQVEGSFHRQGMSTCALFHSHPGGSTELSLADRRTAWAELIQIVCAVPRQGEPSLAAWQMHRRQPHPLSIRIEGR
ncbi:MAG: M67 family metallopeptidase [Planctomycetota bacterium]|jgi:proteasome lid subunit RPN8/RPN11